MVQPLLSHEAAKAANLSTFKVSLTKGELEFMIFQLEASINACKKMGRQPGDPIEENPHFQGLERLLGKYRKALPNWDIGGK